MFVYVSKTVTSINQFIHVRPLPPTHEPTQNALQTQPKTPTARARQSPRRNGPSKRWGCTPPSPPPPPRPPPPAPPAAASGPGPGWGGGAAGGCAPTAAWAGPSCGACSGGAGRTAGGSARRARRRCVGGLFVGGLGWKALVKGGMHTHTHSTDVSNTFVHTCTFNQTPPKKEKRNAPR